jgi:hypothetical protein
MSQFAQLAILIGALTPFLVAIVQRSHFSSRLRTVIGVTMSLIVATLTAYLHGDMNLHSWATAAIGVVGAAAVAYKLIWVPIGAVPWLEAKTTPAHDTA